MASRELAGKDSGARADVYYYGTTSKSDAWPPNNDACKVVGAVKKDDLAAIGELLKKGSGD
jgi:hypothetical protein